ncbi:hypothetical protein F511_43433 [Dorcoceras hygrometricum]|uniref:Uncharacterized protein n=1 Tax=Dorcoceras hygrometricum TaxID=472368 RepID=A0A2Z7BT49_9LAMI|nr:hypothetical protein F511_43433 [Dorcoceras hygrometricum]
MIFGIRLIESTTGSKVPSSVYTRRPDEISTDGNSSKKLAGTNPARGGGGDGGGRRRGCEGEEGAAASQDWRLGFISPRPEPRFLRQSTLEGLTRSARTETPRKVDRNKFRRGAAAAMVVAGGGDVRERRGRRLLKIGG